MKFNPCSDCNYLYSCLDCGYEQLRKNMDNMIQAESDLKIELDTLRKDNKVLRDALKPFANFACGCGECYNCIAKKALKEASE